MEKFKNLFTDKEFILRVLSTIILLPLVLFMTFYETATFEIMVLILSILMSMEWNSMTEKVRNKRYWMIGGILYVFLPTWSLMWLIRQENGSFLVFGLMLVVWGSDVGAYFAGKLIGGPKIAPKISPNKTISGCVGGLCLGIIGGKLSGEINIIGALVLSILSQIGDLIESFIKRSLGVKQSGNILPGHGGILDRVDGIVLAAPSLAIMKYFML